MMTMQTQRKRQKGSPRIAQAHVRKHRALELRVPGASYQAIGEVLGISAQGAHKAVMRVLNRAAERSREDAEALRGLELERLDRLISQLWERALAPDLPSVDRLIGIGPAIASWGPYERRPGRRSDERTSE